MILYSVFRLLSSVSFLSSCPLCLCGEFSSSPQTPIKRSILNSFGQMIGLDSGRCREIGDRPRYLENSIISSGAQVKIDHRFLQQFDTLLIQYAMLPQLSRCHSSVIVTLLWPLNLLS
jgi:hypothetical protein